MTAPYEIVGGLKRFDRGNTVFSRARRDDTCSLYGMAHMSAEEVIAQGKPGCGREDFALHAGAWAMSPTSYEACREHFAGRDDMEAAEYVCEQAGRTEDAAALTRNVKDAARFYGASLVGIARVNVLWIYADDSASRRLAFAEGAGTVIVLAVEMNAGLVRQSPSVASAAATGLGYSRMASVATSLARYLRHLGWRTLACGNDTALSIPLAIDAGLGELGRHGMLITKQFGACVRLCKVFTDVPLVPDEPLAFGAAKVCEGCTKCAEACPAGAIPFGVRTAEAPTVSNNPGVLKWPVDPEKCLAFWRRNGCCCSNCIAACPFTRGASWPPST